MPNLFKISPNEIREGKKYRDRTHDPYSRLPRDGAACLEQRLGSALRLPQIWGHQPRLPEYWTVARRDFPPRGRPCVLAHSTAGSVVSEDETEKAE